ncbi:phage antirepressor KilAC domain-containing protein [Vibrio parahaemolyticus]|uniref:phage antirepressor KilAC domain-containing protein n=1 Tax=Vibrio parahaemolyticus TaxID=670 RepID=UPI001EEC917E|nr:phage antirepressor KilAC domain-containing protein [Vibrio parahaemolyticus]MBE3725426.1 DNA-binding protein [Vibrio parahaemolyticus]MCG6443647.1 phage antirepressor KilAC domain-containing protein [Vibrio parahaemolyticus]MCG6455963.1 phage antirepressor KilAC domain-containing protein [Vibrio parahaemolyticus]HCE2195142.1 phage antirepressor KilAC domain-containing protein [Vibrio parahaemolyticus]HCG6674115.1 phage antirepressor KilAC domain-containing protein [Vibrio parahaemolyticus]
MLSISTQTEMTMSSREIAELTGKRHDHVKRDIERMREELNPPNLGSSIFVHNGNEYTQYHLNRDLTLTLVSGYSIKLRHAIIKRLEELETQSKPQIPQTYADALLLAATQAKELEEKNQALAIAAPKAEFADAIAGADKGVKLGQFAKTVGLGPVTIFRVLRELKIFMSRGDSYNLPYQDYVERGYFTVKQGTYETNSQTRISHTALITGKGEIWLRKKLLETGHLKAVAA